MSQDTRGGTLELVAQGQSSSAVNPSSCRSTGRPEADARLKFPVDDIKQPTTCKLYVPDMFYHTKVATGLAFLSGEGVMLHCRPLPEHYAKVTIDEVVKNRFRRVELDIPGEDDKKTLGENIGCFVAWGKRYIAFGEDSDSDDDDGPDPIRPSRPPITPRVSNEDDGVHPRPPSPQTEGSTPPSVQKPRSPPPPKSPQRQASPPPTKSPQRPPSPPPTVQRSP